MGPKARFVAADASSLLFFCAFCLAVVTFGMLNGDVESLQTEKIKNKKVRSEMARWLKGSHQVTSKDVRQAYVASTC